MLTAIIVETDGIDAEDENGKETYKKDVFQMQ